MHALSPWERRLCFAPPFLMRMLVTALRLFGIGGGSPNALLHIVLQVKFAIPFRIKHHRKVIWQRQSFVFKDLIAVVGATIGALRIPEKWIPGKLDFALNSHNLMHVLVVLAVCSMHAATLQDLLWMIEPSTCDGTSSVPPMRDELWSNRENPFTEVCDKLSLRQPMIYSCRQFRNWWSEKIFLGTLAQEPEDIRIRVPEFSAIIRRNVFYNAWNRFSTTVSTNVNFSYRKQYTDTCPN